MNLGTPICVSSGQQRDKIHDLVLCGDFLFRLKCFG
jgi:hypothetical protein